MTNGRISFLLFLLAAFVSASAQDLQELYDSAKEALLAADPQKALKLIGEAELLLEDDPRLDPNGMFSRRLLPLLEYSAERMAELMEKLQELAEESGKEINWPDVPASEAAVPQYAAAARERAEQLLAARTRLLAESDLPAEYREVLRQSLPFRKIEIAVSSGLMEQLTKKFIHLTSAMADSLRAANRRYAEIFKALEKVKRTPAASQTEIKKLQDQLAQVSKERENLLKTFAKMLRADLSEDVKPVSKALERQNLDTIFTNVLSSEINYLRSVKEVDKKTYQNLLKGYERLEEYNRIFVETGAAKDKRALLRELKASIDSLEMRKWRPSTMFMVSTLGIVLTVMFVLLFRYTAAKSVATGGGNQNTGGGGHAKH